MSWLLASAYRCAEEAYWSAVHADEELDEVEDAYYAARGAYRAAMRWAP
jgi:hypothetical protein